MISNRKKLALALASALAVPAEGLRQVAYRDPPGILTVCYGSTTNVQAGMVYPIAECKRRLDAEMLAALDTVERCVPGLPLPVLAAFSDAVYNLGPIIACDYTHSTAARYLAQGKLIEACNQLPRWSRARVGGIYVELPGLAKRREKEKALCLTGAA